MIVKHLFTKKTGLRFLCFVSLAMLVFGQYSSFASALSPQQLKIFQEGIHYFDFSTCDAAGGAAPTADISGETTEPPKAVQQVVWSTLIGGGVDPMHAAAVMGNIAHEGVWDPENSSENPNAPPRSKDPTVTGPGYGYGLIGWTPGQSLLDQMKQAGINGKPYTAETQAAVILAEIQGKTTTYSPDIGKQFLNTNSIEDATTAYQGNANNGGPYLGFERPADEAGTLDDRIASAKQFLQEFGGSAPAATPSTVAANGGSCCPPNGSAAAGSPVFASDDEATIWNYLVTQMQLSSTQAAGIMGNMKQESGFSPTATNPSSGAYGIAQWYAERETALANFAASKGKDKSDITVQLDYLKSELDGSYKSAVLDPIRNSNDLNQVIKIWLLYYEKPCLASDTACVSSEMNNRIPFAKDVLQKYGDGAAATVSPDACAGSGADNVAGANGWNLPPDQNAMVYYGQCDPQWADHPYGAGKSSICVGGCGITSMSMVVATLADKSQTPKTMADKYGDTYHTSGGTSWALWPAAAGDFNLKEKDIGLDFGQAAATVKAGGLVIIAVNPGKFTSEGHVMVIRAVTDNGDFLLADPNNDGSKQLGRGDTNNTPYSADTLKGPGAAMNMWAFTK